MKVNNVIRSVYSESEPLYARLSSDVKDRLKVAVENKGWFFTHRIKTLESFAMKIETGRVADPASLDDFFACTVVVPTMGDLEDAESLVYLHYSPVSRRPKTVGETHKRPWNFEFDDLRLYVKRKPQMSGAAMDLDELVFEIQVKTVLQYAWSVATHDLIYKTDAVSWPKERIAFQVKAMLEHAELVIAEASTLATASGFQKQDAFTKEILETIGVIERIWDKDQLPADRKRLAENVVEIMKVADVDAEKLSLLLTTEIERNRVLPADLSPYAFIVQALANSKIIDLNSKLRARRRLKIFIHSGMELPPWCDTHPQCVSVGRGPRMR